MVIKRINVTRKANRNGIINTRALEFAELFNQNTSREQSACYQSTRIASAGKGYIIHTS